MLGPKSVTIDKQLTDNTSELLHIVLSNLITLSIKSRNYHWNVTGPTFHSDCKLYHEVDCGSTKFSNDIGETLRILQYKVKASLSFFDQTNIIDDGDEDFTPAEMKEDILEALEAICTHIQGILPLVINFARHELEEIDHWAGKMSYIIKSSK